MNDVDGQKNNLVTGDQLAKTGTVEGVMKYKIPLISLVVVSLMAVASWAVYTSYSEKENNRLGRIVYEFKSDYFKKLQEDKMSAGEFVGQFKKLVGETGKFTGLVSLNIGASDYLIKKNHLDEAKELLEIGSEKFSSDNPYVNWFISTRLATVYEDLKQEKKAIEVLEKLNSSSVKLMEWKLYLDLGRLYMKTGNKDKARSNFKYVVDNYSDMDFSKIARIYLGRIDKR